MELQTNSDPATTAGKDVAAAAGASKEAAEKAVVAKDTTAAGSKESGSASSSTAGKPPEAKGSDYSISLPEGVEADKALLEGITADAKELGLPKEGLQKLVDRYAASVKAAGENQAKALAETREGWVKEIKTMPEFAGEKFAPAKEGAMRVAAKFGGPSLVELLQGPLGDHPGIFRLCAMVAAADSEDKVGANNTRGANPPPKTREAQWRTDYPTMYPKKE